MRPANKSRKVSLYLQTKQPRPLINAEFQLWLAHLQDDDKTIHKCTMKCSCRVDVLLYQQAFAPCRRCTPLH